MFSDGAKPSRCRKPSFWIRQINWSSPFLSAGIGVSPVALLVSAMYWSWLWGAGAARDAGGLSEGRGVTSELGFFGILLGADSGSDDII